MMSLMETEKLMTIMKIIVMVIIIIMMNGDGKDKIKNDKNNEIMIA